jgi:parvulin-like peptidyl-prolyl isomerase
MRAFSITVVVASLFLVITWVPRTFGADDEVLAKIGNEVITKIDFETRLKTFSPAVQATLKDFQNRKQLLDNMIKARLLVAEGGSKGLTEKAEVKAYLRMIRDDLITQEYVRAYIENKVKVSDEEVENYYNTDPEIEEREYLKVSEIVVEKEAEAREILQLLKKGENFNKLARERSIDPESKSKAGELDLFEKGKGRKEIEDAVSKLEEGGISDIVKTKGGYSIFKLDSRKIDPKIPFLKVKDQIIRKLKLKKLTELVEKETEELKKKIPVEAFYDKLIPDAK